MWFLSKKYKKKKHLIDHFTRLIRYKDKAVSDSAFKWTEFLFVLCHMTFSFKLSWCQSGSEFSMGGKCLLARCKIVSGLHWFPRDADRARLWLQAVGWPSTPDTSRLFVCNKHFSRESFYRHEDYGIAHGGNIRREDTDKSLKYLSIPTGQPVSFLITMILSILLFLCGLKINKNNQFDYK